MRVILFCKFLRKLHTVQYCTGRKMFLPRQINIISSQLDNHICVLAAPPDHKRNLRTNNIAAVHNVRYCTVPYITVTVVNTFVSVTKYCMILHCAAKPDVILFCAFKNSLDWLQSIRQRICKIYRSNSCFRTSNQKSIHVL